jgi:hypothetical protein
MFSFNRSEINDFVDECKRRGISEDDFMICGFNVDDLVDRPLDVEVITVVKAHLTKSYQTADFPGVACIDIVSGVFG